MTEDQNKEFDLLQFADDLSYANWQTLKFLYNEKFREAEKRNKELEAELAEERRSREEAQAFAWRFSDALRKIESKHWYPTTAEIARAALGEKKSDD